MPDTYENLTNEQKDEIRKAMAASNPSDTGTLKEQNVEDEISIFSNEILEVINGIDKSVYADIINNEKTSDLIFTFIKENGALARIGFKSQLNHYSEIADEYRKQKYQRTLIMRNAQGRELTADERRVLETKTQFETMLETATKTYFETERVNCLDLIKRETQSYEARVINSPDLAKPTMLKAAIEQGLMVFGKGVIPINGRKQLGHVFKFSERDLPKFVYDKEALDEYVNAYDNYVRENVKGVELQVKIREYGNAMDNAAKDLTTMGRDARYQDLSREKYDRLHDNFEKKHREAKKVYDNYVKKAEKDPAYKSNLNSLEYQKVLGLEYFDRKYEGMPVDRLPEHDRISYILHKHEKVSHMNLYRVPKEERELLDKALLVSAMPRVLEMESNLDNVEKTMEKLWNNTRDTSEKVFQKRELEENRAIIAAYKQYYTDGTKESKQKFFDEFNKAYDNAKQAYINNPDLRERFELRAEQLSMGDFTFVPVSNKKEAKSYGMTANWDKITHTRVEYEELKNIPKTENEKKYERAFSIHIEGLQRKALIYEVKRDAERRPTYTLGAMGMLLSGEKLRSYKESIRDEKMEKLSDLNVEIKGIKADKDALKKQYGLFSRMFSTEYKEQKASLDKKLDTCRKNYDAALKQTRYDILKTYQEKDLHLKRSERRELNALTKDAEKTGQLKKWDTEREEEKKLLSELNSKETEKTQDEEKVASTKQLDLGDKLNKTKTVEQPQKETQIEKSKEKEKTVEEKDIER